MNASQKIEKIFSDVEKSLSSPAPEEDTDSLEYPDEWPTQVEDGADIFPIEKVNDFPSAANSDEGIDPGVGEVISDSGIEAIAIYKSPRFIKSRPFKGKWGIFIYRQRFVSLASTMASDTQSPFQGCSKTLHGFIDSHEKFHFKVDSRCLELESFTKQPLWRPYHARLQQLPVIEWLEEGIANSTAYTSIKNGNQFNPPAPRAHVEFIEGLIEASPGAYAFGTQSRKMLTAIRSEMAKQILCIPQNTQLLGDQEFQIRTFNERLSSRSNKLFDPNSIPRYWVSNLKAYQRTSPLAIKINEIRDGFIVKYLNGQFKDRTDHERFQIDNRDLVKVPNPHSKDLKEREFRNLIGHAGMSKFEFEIERGRTKKWQKDIPRNPIKPSKLKSNA